jgi:hypothetical protein
MVEMLRAKAPLRAGLTLKGPTELILFYLGAPRVHWARHGRRLGLGIRAVESCRAYSPSHLDAPNYVSGAEAVTSSTTLVT